MKIFHSPGCRITSTSVMQGSRSNQAFSQQSFALTVNIQVFDPRIWVTSGGLSVNHTILQDGKVVANYGTGWWLATSPVRFSTSFWMSHFFPKAAAAAPGNGPFLYRPSLAIVMWGPGGKGLSDILTEFAVAEEESYFSIS
jgi:hypothetical protein